MISSGVEVAPASEEPEMFKHPKCGGQHETVFQARECEANARFAAETERGHDHFLATGRDEDAEAEQFLAGTSAKLANGHATSPILASLHGPIDKTAILSKRVDSLFNSGHVEPAPASRYENYATPSMENFVVDLIAERETEGLTGEHAEALMDKIDGKRLYFSQARMLIETLKHAPKRSEVKAARTEAKQGWRALADQVPEGRYALPNGPGQDKPHFYRLSKRNGFVKLQEQASDSLFPIELRNYATILQAILDYRTERSGLLYATLIGSCRRCGRTLTDENNPYRASGYGPDCGAKL
jgi:hypothetical protein